MNFRSKNGLRDFQVGLKELGLYDGGIDGAWGPKSALAASTLTRSYGESIGRGPLSASTFPSSANEDANNVITQLQYYMAGFGIYTTGIDGKWGPGTASGVTQLIEKFRAINNLPKYDVAWSKKVSKAFAARVKEWCASKGLHPLAASWLIACMHFESGGTFSPSKQNNGGSNFFGLIQFGEDAAKDLKTTLPKLIAMTQMEQLEYVFKYFEMWSKRGKKYTQLEDFYLTIFYPAAVGRKADEVLFRKDSTDRFEARAYVQNNGFDKTKSGVITVGQICSTIYDTYYKGMDPVNRVTL